MLPSYRDLLRTLAALPFLAFLYAMAFNEYFFVPTLMQAGAAAIVAGGIAYRIIRRKRAHTPFWLLVFLSVYNFPMVFGGLVYFKLWLFPLSAACLAAGYFLSWRMDRPRRAGAAAVCLAFFGIMSLHFFRNLDLDSTLNRCGRENARLDPAVRLIDGERHTYDFARTPAFSPNGERIEGKSLIAAAYGMSKKILWFDDETGRRIRETKLPREGEVQRMTPSLDARTLYLPPWGRRGVREEILVLDAATGRSTGVIPVNYQSGQAQDSEPINHCRNLFEIAVDPEKGTFYALCEVSHSLVSLDAKTMKMRGEVILPGRDAYDMVFDPATRRLFTTDYWSRYLTVVDADALRVEKTVPIGWSSFGILLSGRRIYVARPLASEVVELDADSLAVVRRIKVGFGVRDLESDEGRGILFAGNYFDGTVDALDMRSGRRLRRAFAGQLLRGLLFHPDRDRLYLATGCGVKTIELKNWLDEKN